MCKLAGLVDNNLPDEAFFMAHGGPAFWIQKEVHSPGMLEE